MDDRGATVGTAGVINIVVINLANRTDRWESIHQHLQTIQKMETSKNQPCPFVVHRLEAVRDETNGARGCSKSHAAAIRLASENGWDNVLVLEDDARLRTPLLSNDGRIPGRLSTLLESVEEYAWDAIFLGAGRATGTVVVNEYAMKLAGSNVRRYVTGSHAVMYHSRAYAELIRLFERDQEGMVHVDLIISTELPASTVLLACPYIAEFIDSSSDVRTKSSAINDIAHFKETEARLMDQRGRAMEKYPRNTMNHF